MADSPSPAPSESPQPSEPSDVEAFERAAEQPSPGILWEFFYFLRYNKKWWLAPIIIAILLGALVMVLGTVLPFLYPV